MQSGLKDKTTWSEGIALVDFILGIAHSGPWEIRRCVFEHIAAEVEISRPLKGTSHDGLLIAAWALLDWPARGMWLAERLDATTLKQLLATRVRPRAPIDHSSTRMDWMISRAAGRD
jgi:hypothetical protein